MRSPFVVITAALIMASTLSSDLDFATRPPISATPIVSLFLAAANTSDVVVAWISAVPSPYVVPPFFVGSTSSVPPTTFAVLVVLECANEVLLVTPMILTSSPSPSDSPGPVTDVLFASAISDFSVRSPTLDFPRRPSDASCVALRTAFV